MLDVALQFGILFFLFAYKIYSFLLVEGAEGWNKGRRRSMGVAWFKKGKMDILNAIQRKKYR